MVKKLVHFDTHHRKPTSRFKKGEKGANELRNLSKVPIPQHRAWHTLFRNLSAQEIAAIITDVWVDPDFYFVAVPRGKKAPEKKFEFKTTITCAKCGGLCTMNHKKIPVLRLVK